MVPVIGLVPLAVAVLATRGAFSPPPLIPVAAGPTEAISTTTAAAAPTVTLAAATATSVSAPAPTAATSTSATAAPTAGTAAAAPTPASAATSTTSSSAPGSATSVAQDNPPYVAYRVQPGDTVRFVARTYGVSAASVAQASGLANPDLLRVGQVLTIPAQPGWLYRLQQGETLDQIAARTGVDSDRIASASGLTAASVRSGDVLLIPDQSAAAQSK